MKLPQAQESSRLIRWGIIGPGRAAARFAQGLTAVPNSTLTAVWGRNEERTHAFAKKFTVPLTAVSLDDLLATDIDAVYVATHPDTHSELCIRALAASKHVLCEKPSALNQRQLIEILKAANLHDRLFMEAMKPPFFPLYQRLRQHLATDPIGPIGFVRAGHCDSSLAPDYPLHFPELGGGGIMGIGPYEAFLALDIDEVFEVPTHQVFDLHHGADCDVAGVISVFRRENVALHVGGGEAFGFGSIVEQGLGGKGAGKKVAARSGAVLSSSAVTTEVRNRYRPASICLQSSWVASLHSSSK